MRVLCCEAINENKFKTNSKQIQNKFKTNSVLNAQQCFAFIWYHWTQGYCLSCVQEKLENANYKFHFFSLDLKQRCMDSWECIGARRSLNGLKVLNRLWNLPCISTIITVWMVQTLMVLQVSHLILRSVHHMVSKIPNIQDSRLLGAFYCAFLNLTKIQRGAHIKCLISILSHIARTQFTEIRK